MTNSESRTATASHTPGPWTAFALASRVVHPGIEANELGLSIVIVGDKDHPEDGGGVRGRTDLEAAANARLIATAPDMLAALQEAELQIEYLHEKFQETGTGNAALARVHAAIAKATHRE